VKPFRTWVLPNRNAIGLVAVLAGMWYAGVTQSNGAAYLLCFVLASVAAVSTVHTWSNLKGVVIEADAIHTVFAGEELSVPLRAWSVRGRGHFGIRVVPLGGGAPAVFPALPPHGATAGLMRARALQRGSFATLPVRIESRFPLGFFTARRKVTLAAQHCVYPAPAGSRPLPVSLAPARAGRDGTRTEGDDFGGVGAWRTGESQRHIDWKAAARGQPLLIKQWSGDADTTIVLDWDLLADLAPEARLSQLARWVVQAERGGSQYALRLPGASVPPARGEAHYHSCLRRLAELSITEAQPSAPPP
jgi:uncharacterized protein (DUF58 family)